MARKNITINDLAVMVKKGFDGVDENFEKTATKEQVEILDKKVYDLKKWAEGRFDKIEKIILDDHRERIEKLESKVQYLENMLSLPAKN